MQISNTANQGRGNECDMLIEKACGAKGWTYVIPAWDYVILADRPQASAARSRGVRLFHRPPRLEAASRFR
jgi:hypothetical protein